MSKIRYKIANFSIFRVLIVNYFKNITYLIKLQSHAHEKQQVCWNYYSKRALR